MRKTRERKFFPVWKDPGNERFFRSGKILGTEDFVVQETKSLFCSSV